MDHVSKHSCFHSLTRRANYGKQEYKIVKRLHYSSSNDFTFSIVIISLVCLWCALAKIYKAIETILRIYSTGDCVNNLQDEETINAPSQTVETVIKKIENNRFAVGFWTNFKIGSRFRKLTTIAPKRCENRFRLSVKRDENILGIHQ